MTIFTLPFKSLAAFFSFILFYINYFQNTIDCHSTHQNYNKLKQLLHVD